MRKYHGKGVCNTIAIGEAFVLKKQDTRIDSPVYSANSDIELKRFKKAKTLALKQTKALYDKAIQMNNKISADIFESHYMMLQDNGFNNCIKNYIKDESLNAEHAVFKALNLFSDRFKNLDDPYMRARHFDIKDICERLIACLQEKYISYSKLKYDCIVCANDITPGELINFDHSKLLGFAFSCGSVHSHTAILAKSLNIALSIHLGDGFLASVKNGDIIAINGYTGEVFVNPDDKTLKELNRIKTEEVLWHAKLDKLKGKTSKTLDGKKIRICANIATPNEIPAVINSDADGIGLVRSEFLYLGRDNFPTEDEQFLSYKTILEGMGSKNVIIRTLDIGSDKKVDYFNIPKEKNPAMGLRAIRICLKKPDILITQLRALYRASVYGNLSIMFPMITSVDETLSLIDICNKVKQALLSENIPFSNNVKIGLTIETPAAAIISDQLAKIVDFFSLGTNDLIQYTLACDRENSEVDKFLDKYHDAVFKLIEITAKNAQDSSIPVGICGDLAADTSVTEKLLKMGIDNLSVPASDVLNLRKTVRSIRLN
ncbi:MAG: phosphoenolpyruvate--protein phosphotransferase [Clostridia bacterium]|nr:phosphoenolpyruvate--protein phosphotransferase [Clostridia bacterium]